MINMAQTAGHITCLRECWAMMGLCFSGDNNTICAISAFSRPKMWSGSVHWQACAPRVSTTAASSLFPASTHLPVVLALLSSLANPPEPPKFSTDSQCSSFSSIFLWPYVFCFSVWNLLVSTQFVAPHPTTLFFSCPLALLVLPSQCPSLPVLTMPGTVQSDCFGSLCVLPQDLLLLTLDVTSVFVLVAFYWFSVRF